MDNIIKMILKTPKGTPREALYIETGLLDPTTIIKRNRVNMESRLRIKGSKMVKEILNNRLKNGWMERTETIKQELNIETGDTIGPKEVVKKKINTKTHIYFKRKITTEGAEKSKVKYLLEGKGQEWTPGQRPKYMSELTRNQASTIFKARTRMLPFKDNYRTGKSNLLCRACSQTTETQSHALEECRILHTDPETRVEKRELFQEESTELKKVAKKIDNILKTLEGLTT